MKNKKLKQKTKKKGTIREFGQHEYWLGLKNKKSQARIFRDVWLADGIELVDITKLCEIKINCHGQCNGLNEPEERIYHIKIIYRDEIIAQSGGDKIEVIDNDKYCVWVESDLYDNGFIIFRKIKIKQETNKRK